MIPSKQISSDAKEIAFYYFEATNVNKTTPNIIKKTISQAKSLLTYGYTKEEILKVIDYIVNVKKVKMYSIGYVFSAINNILKEIDKIEVEKRQKEIVEQTKKEIASTNEAKRNEVILNNESTKRNQDKLNRFGIQSRFGKEFDCNMFKE